MTVSLSIVEVFASHPERGVLKSIVVVVAKSFRCSIVVVTVVLFVFGSRAHCLSGLVWSICVVVFWSIYQK